jgi:hypothetical protein
MKVLNAIAVATAVAMPAAALAQAYPVYQEARPVYPTAPAYPGERLTVHDRNSVARDGSAIHAGANNPADAALAYATGAEFAADRRLDRASATISANNGRVSISGFGNEQQNQRAQAAASRVAGRANVSGGLASDLG